MAEPTIAATARDANHGRLWIVAAILLWSTSGVFSKAPLLEFWPLEQRGSQIAFWRTLFACGLLFPLVRRPVWTWRLIPACIAFAMMNYCYVTALTVTTAANAIWLQYTAPAIVFVVSVLFLGKRADRRDWIMLVLCIAGVALIAACEGRAASVSGQSAAGVFWGILSGFGFAFTVISLRALRDIDSALVVALCHGTAATVLLPTVAAQPAWPPSHVLIWLAAFGMFQMGLPYFLFARGTRTVTAHEAAFIGLLEPLLVPVWTFVAWRHSPSYQSPATWTYFGAALILAGLIVRYARFPRKKYPCIVRKGLVPNEFDSTECDSQSH